MPMDSYYDDISQGYDQLHREEQLNKLGIIRTNLKINKKTKMLDVGCGTGLAAEVFDCELTGVEPSREMASMCSFKVINTGAEQLPFKDKEFDIVISVTAIHNFDDIEKGLKEMKRVGKQFAFSILKKSKRFKDIDTIIRKEFKIKKIILEEKDIIYFTKKCQN